jgi:hypothetical protein
MVSPGSGRRSETTTAVRTAAVPDLIALYRTYDWWAAREGLVPFYESCGFEVRRPGPRPADCGPS